MHYLQATWISRLPSAVTSPLFVTTFVSLLIVPIIAAIILSRYYLLWFLSFLAVYAYLISVGH